VNAISAGPIKLWRREELRISATCSDPCGARPLKRNVDAAEVGATAAFLLSEAGSGITGETIFVDCGYNIMGFEWHRHSSLRCVF